MELRTWIADDLAQLRTRLHDQVLARVPLERHHELVDGGGAPVVALLWHVARHQDLGVHGVVRGGRQLVGDWWGRVGAAGAGAPAEFGLAEAESRELTAALDPAEVVAYLDAVLDATSAWLTDADLAVLDEVPDSAAALAAAGVREAEVPWLYRMWSGRPGAFYVGWEAIGHGVTHTGELVSMRNRMGLSPH